MYLGFYGFHLHHGNTMRHLRQQQPDDFRGSAVFRAG